MSGKRKYKTQAEQFAEFVSGEPDSDRLIEVFESFREMQDEEKRRCLMRCRLANTNTSQLRMLHSSIDLTLYGYQNKIA